MPGLQRLLYLPDLYGSAQTGNAYTAHMVAAWQVLGLQPCRMPRGYAEKWRALRQRKTTVGVLNWVENVMVDRDGQFSWVGVMRFLSTVVKMRVVCRTLIFVRHNVHPHATRIEDADRVARLIDLAERWLFTHSMAHAPRFRTAFRSYVPHPAYKFARPVLAMPPQSRVTYFGAVLPYKSLDRLIDAWRRDDVELCIAGRADPAYLATLQKRARGKAVRFLGVVERDEDARDLLSSSIAAVLPHDGASMVVSGSLYFAMSSGVPLLAVDNRHARDLIAEGMPGVLNLSHVDEINAVDFDVLSRIDRSEIAAQVQRRFGTAAVASALRAMLRQANLPGGAQRPRW